MPTDLKELRRQAGFVFVGTVEKLGAVATAGVAASPTTAVVRVGHVVSAPPGLAGNLGQTVTLDLASKDLKEGDSATFFATSWVYGEGLALREIGHTAQTDLGEVTDLVASASAEVRNDQLTERVESAALIVLGRVARIEEPQETAERRLSGEHEARWWIARIKAEEVIKGTPRGSEVVLAFPTSSDIAWYGAPRPQANQQAVWLLHKESHHELPQGAYVALDPRDVQPPATAPHIRELVKG